MKKAIVILLLLVGVCVQSSEVHGDWLILNRKDPFTDELSQFMVQYNGNALVSVNKSSIAIFTNTKITNQDVTIIDVLLRVDKNTTQELQWVCLAGIMSAIDGNSHKDIVKQLFKGQSTFVVRLIGGRTVTERFSLKGFREGWNALK